MAVAADLEAGFALMGRLAAWDDKDVTWALKQNLSKKRLAQWPDRVEAARARLQG